MNTISASQNSGIKWGPFTLRIPFIHIKFRAPEFLQGLVISGATAFAAAPLAMKLGLTFEEAVALSMVAGTFSTGPIILESPWRLVGLLQQYLLLWVLWLLLAITEFLLKVQMLLMGM